MISLIIALLIIAVVLYGVIDYKRVMPKVERFYKQFGVAGTPLMYFSALLVLLVLGVSMYMALEWARGDDVTFQEVGREGLSAAERYSDQLGELVETGVEKVESLWDYNRLSPAEDLQPPKAAPSTGSAHMDFNAGAQQYLWGPNKYPDLYRPELIDGDGSCHPLVKGNCEGEGRLLKHHSYVQTCNQVTVSPPMRFDSSIHAWTVV